ncbi:MAG: hypothetical protein J6O53_03015, partial [Eubacterium sp.]|nr:hypothetical protein [Eubacterium sp.]
SLLISFVIFFSDVKKGDWGSPQQAAKGTLGDLSGAKNAQCTSLRCLPHLGQDGQNVINEL